MFDCLRAFWPKAYQRGSLRKRQYLKQAMQKSYPPKRFENVAFGLPVHLS